MISPQILFSIDFLKLLSFEAGHFLEIMFHQNKLYLQSRMSSLNSTEAINNFTEFLVSQSEKNGNVHPQTHLQTACVQYIQTEFG